MNIRIKMRNTAEHYPHTLVFGFMLLCLPLVLIISWSVASRWEVDQYRISIEQANNSLNLRLQQASQDFEVTLAQLRGLPEMLAADPKFIQALQHPKNQQYQSVANQFIKDESRYLLVDVAWLIDAHGQCLASSNFDTTESLVGENYADRVYFKEAIVGNLGRQFAIGRRTNIPGLFFSSPVRDNTGVIIGVIVLKADLSNVSRRIRLRESFMTDDQGVVILADQEDMLFKTLPNAPIQNTAEDFRQKRYKRSEFSQIEVTPAGITSYPEVQLFGNRKIPALVRTIERPQDGFTSHIIEYMPQLSNLEDQRLFYFIISSISVLAVLWGVFATLVFVSRARIYRKNIETANVELHSLINRLADSESRLNTILDNSSVGITFVKNRRQIWSNKRMGELLGYSVEEMAGQNTSMFFPSKEAYDALGEQAYPMLATGKSFSSELQMARRDGSRIWMRLTGKAIDSNDPKAGSIWVIEDITERKLAEQALEESRESLRISEAQMAASQQLGGTGSWVYYIATNVIRASAQSLAMFGFPSGARDFLLDDFLACIPDRERVRRVLADAISNEHEYDDEFDIIPANGSPSRTINSIGRLEKDEQGNLVRVLGFIQDITQRKQMEEEVRKLAFYDVLTSLPNRRLFCDRLGLIMASTKRSGCYGAVMFLDLDNFKPLNDTHGHEVGDLLLIEVANRLRSCVRETDTVGRFGGDEFVVALSELSSNIEASTTQARIVADKTAERLSEPYLLTIKQEGKADTTVEHHCSASIGVVLFLGYEASQDEIINWADSAMYQAKSAGRNMVRFYDSQSVAATNLNCHGEQSKF